MTPDKSKDSCNDNNKNSSTRIPCLTYGDGVLALQGLGQGGHDQAQGNTRLLLHVGRVGHTGGKTLDFKNYNFTRLIYYYVKAN